MKIVAGVGGFVFFGEVVLWPQIVAFLLIVVSVSLLYYDKKIKMKAVEKFIVDQKNLIQTQGEVLAGAAVAGAAGVGATAAADTCSPLHLVEDQRQHHEQGHLNSSSI